jgi:hypothetical protein
MFGFRLGGNIGDQIQFTSLPENYFRSRGKRLVDLDKHWAFDDNPYVVRGVQDADELKLWDIFCSHIPQKDPLSTADIGSSIFGLTTTLNRPRLYRFESYPYHFREKILLHVSGLSNGKLPQEIIDHVINKYGKDLIQIGLPTDTPIGIPIHPTPTLWSLAATISEARMFIGVDSGPGWIARCYPDVVTKIIKLRNYDGVPLKKEVTLSYFDDRSAMFFNPTERDVGFTSSYLKL